MKTYKLNQKVAWTSQSQGYVKTKTGKIVCVVPPGSLPAHLGYPKLGKNCLSRNDESYVVEVPPKGKGAPTHYWPRTSALVSAA